MPRELRPRKAHQSYTAFVEEDEGGAPEAEPSHTGPRASDDSGSDSLAPVAAGGVPFDDDYDDDDDADALAVAALVDAPSPTSEAPTPAPDTPAPKPPAKKSKGKGKAAAKATPPAPGARPRQNYSLPNPNVHHRHRPAPLAGALRAERLLRPPALFTPPVLGATHAYAARARRVGKAWGASIGPGPVWQVVEDVGWFREARGGEGAGAETEGARRPRVHGGVRVPGGWGVLGPRDAGAYLPTGEGGRAPSVSCDFGPFGAQTNVELAPLGAQKLSEFLPESRAHVFNAGASVWGLDWCPIHPDDRPHCNYKYYLAAGPFPSHTHSPNIGVKVSRPAPACVQIWSLCPSSSDAAGSEGDRGEIHCELVLCIDSGPALELKWCPLPSNDPLSGPSPVSPRKLGLLAGIFGDGSLSVYVVPYPPDLAATQPPSLGPVHVKLPEPIVRIELEEAACCTLDWANSEVVAIGLANGAIAVYNIARALSAPSELLTVLMIAILPTHYFCVHQSALRALAWVRIPDRNGNGPTVIASGGYDGLQCLTDIRDVGGHVFNRTRDAISAIAYSPFLSAAVTIDHENVIKSYSVAPSTLGRGHALMDPGGPVWSISASDYHPQLAVGSADGTCCTTNGLRSTRRGGYVPFLVHRVYQLDYSRNAGRFRMLDRLKPREMLERPEGGGGAWDVSVGVQRVAWHSGAGLAAAGLLASATGSGLCRVDFLDGRFIRDRVPYESVEAMRLEDGDEMDVDEADEEDSS
ncbi:hypothetical protein BC834DRAFT_827534 [Gloeopeniophorella convolvens]|nr:hypothetical protein BC834DRAFT_827534 [Gloeopeniophorella convolvens]